MYMYVSLFVCMRLIRILHVSRGPRRSTRAPQVKQTLLPLDPCKLRGHISKFAQAWPVQIQHVFLSKEKTGLPVEQEDMSSCWTRRHVLLLNRKTCLPVQHEDMSSCSTGGYVFLLNKKTCILVGQEHLDMQTCTSQTRGTLESQAPCKLDKPSRQTFDHVLI